MALFPGIVTVDLLPQAGRQPVIRPAFIVGHSTGDPGATVAQLRAYWARTASPVFSHFIIDGATGEGVQLQDTDHEAPAQYAGNGGGISIEVTQAAADMANSEPMSAAALERIAQLIAAIADHYAWPALHELTATDWTRPGGIGGHSSVPAWNLDSHACPGAARLPQWLTHVPTLATSYRKGSTMALTPEDLAEVRTVVREAIGEALGGDPIGNGQTSWAGTIAATLRVAEETVNVAQAVSKVVSDVAQAVQIIEDNATRAAAGAATVLAQSQSNGAQLSNLLAAVADVNHSIQAAAVPAAAPVPAGPTAAPATPDAPVASTPADASGAATSDPAATPADPAAAPPADDTSAGAHPDAQRLAP